MGISLQGIFEHDSYVKWIVDFSDEVNDSNVELDDEAPSTNKTPSLYYTLEVDDTIRWPLATNVGKILIVHDSMQDESTWNICNPIQYLEYSL